MGSVWCILRWAAVNDTSGPRVGQRRCHDVWEGMVQKALLMVSRDGLAQSNSVGGICCVISKLRDGNISGMKGLLQNARHIYCGLSVASPKVVASQLRCPTVQMGW